jgi:hypothetical protein
MREANMNDLSSIAKIKSKLMDVHWQLTQENLCTKNEAAGDVLSIISEVIELENRLQSDLILK